MYFFCGFESYSNNLIILILILLLYKPVQFGTDGYQASFTINIRHDLIPKLYDPGPAGPKGGNSHRSQHVMTHTAKPFQSGKYIYFISFTFFLFF